MCLQLTSIVIECSLYDCCGSVFQTIRDSPVFMLLFSHFLFVSYLCAVSATPTTASVVMCLPFSRAPSSKARRPRKLSGVFVFSCNLHLVVRLVSCSFVPCSFGASIVSCDYVIRLAPQ